MTNILRRVFKDNFMISLPTLVISVFLLLFLFIGISTKDSTYVSYSNSLLEEQAIIEEVLSDSSIVYSIEEPYIAVNPYEISPLTALVIFTTDLEVSIEVTVHGKTEEADIVYVTDPNTLHLIPVYGLYADYFNTVTLKIVDSNEDDKVIIIETRKLPVNIELPNEITTTYEYFGNDLMIFNHPSGGPVGYDFLGDVRWYLTEKVFYSADVLKNGLLLIGSERSLFEGISRTSLYEMDFLGKIYTEYIVPNGYTGQAIELPNNNLLVSSNSDNGGANNSLVELDRNLGNVVNTFDTFDSFPTSDGKNNLWSSYNYFDIAGLAFDETTNSVYISGKNQDVIINVDYDNFTLNYVIGDPLGFNSTQVELYFLTPINTPFSWQYAQSDIELLDNGDLLVFDNGYERTKSLVNNYNILGSYSRGVVYHIDSSQMTIEQVSEFGSSFGTTFYSLYLGSVDSYFSNNYLIHSGSINNVNAVPTNTHPGLYDGITEVNTLSKTYEVLDGNIVYHIEFEINYLSAKRVDITTHTNFSFGSNYFGEFNVIDYVHLNIDSSISIFDKIPNRFKISLVEEKDRLVLRGDFEPTDEVYLVLENSYSSTAYFVPTTKVALSNLYDSYYFDDLIEYYIPNTGLLGEYDIYLSVNGKKYNTYEKIIFTD